jgi:Septum formation
MRTRGWTIVTGVVAAGLIAGTQTASAETTSSVPKVGQCYNYTYAQSAGESLPTRHLSCTKKHTAVTYYVGKFSGAAAKSSSPTAKVVEAALAFACTRQLYSKLGPKVTLTRAFQAFTYFEPTAAQWKAGARFYVCDATLFREHPTEFQSIPANYLKVIRTSAGQKKYRWCMTSTFATVPCTSKHATKALTYVTLGKVSEAYPGDAVVVLRTEKACLKAVPRVSGHAWGGTFWRPPAAWWPIGARTATCFQ